MKLLIIDDDQGLCESLCEFFKHLNYDVAIAFNGFHGLAQATLFRPDCILLDWVLPDICGIDLIPQLRQLSLAPIVMLSAMPEVRNVVRSLKIGAEDFIFKPFSLLDLSQVVGNLIQMPASGLHAELALPDPRFLRLPSPAMQGLYGKIERVAKFRDVVVLIHGETGSGKEHLVKYLHEKSGPAGRPLMEINCGAVPESLFESELFGYEAGAFTDARQKRVGILEAASGGTVFLDEVGELPLQLQSKLLKAIEERRMRRLGGTKDIELDIQVVAATNKDLGVESQGGRFRQDLYYRLNGYAVTVPALRQRPEDIPVLATHFYRQARRKALMPEGNLEPEFIFSLQAYPWPGNVRELRNFISAGVIDGSLQGLKRAVLPSGTPSDAVKAVGPSQQLNHRQSKRASLVEALGRHGGNLTRAAKELGITRQTLAKWTKIENLD